MTVSVCTTVVAAAGVHVIVKFWLAPFATFSVGDETDSTPLRPASVPVSVAVPVFAMLRIDVDGLPIAEVIAWGYETP